MHSTDSRLPACARRRWRTRGATRRSQAPAADGSAEVSKLAPTAQVPAGRRYRAEAAYPPVATTRTAPPSMGSATTLKGRHRRDSVRADQPDPPPPPPPSPPPPPPIPVSENGPADPYWYGLFSWWVRLTRPLTTSRTATTQIMMKATMPPMMMRRFIGPPLMAPTVPRQIRIAPGRPSRARDPATVVQPNGSGPLHRDTRARPRIEHHR